MNLRPLLAVGGVAGLGTAGYLFLHNRGDDDKKAKKKPEAPKGPETDPAVAAAEAAGLPAGARQKGPYTIIPDPSMGVEVVFETATKQPIGYLDAQGNLVPLDQPLGQGQVPGGGTPGSQATAGSAYESLAEELFPDPNNPAVGTAGSDAQTGAATVTGQPEVAAQTRQFGPYTIVTDAQSQMQLVFETATKIPVGVLDNQGNLVPVHLDPQGNVSLSRPNPGSFRDETAMALPGDFGLVAGRDYLEGVNGTTNGFLPLTPAAEEYFAMYPTGE